MSITIHDPALLEQLTSITGQVELRDPSGQLVGTLFREVYGVPPPGVRSPVSDEEFEELRKDPSPGRSLSEILRDLREKYGE
jgi:hypothetical protein